MKQMRRIISKFAVLFLALAHLQAPFSIIQTVQAANATISGNIFYDTNKNGINDGGDAIMPFLSVSLFDGETRAQGPVIIDTTGYYEFSITIDGTYHVVFENLPTNYSFSPTDIGGSIGINGGGGSESTDSDVDGSGHTETFVISGTEALTNVDAGAYIDNFRVGDFVWVDANDSGTQDFGETGVTGVDVILQDLNTSTILDSDTTAVDGSYELITELPTCIGPNALWQNGNGAFDCTGINVTGGEYELTFTTSADCEAQFTNITLVTANGDTIYDGTCGPSGENLHNGTSYTFQLGTEMGTGTAHLVISENAPSGGIGNIMLAYKKHQVNFSNIPVNLAFTSQDTGVDESIDSDVDASGNSATVYFAAGQVVDNLDAGLCETCNFGGGGGSGSGSSIGTIGGVAWLDSDNDGIREYQNGEQYRPALNVFLYRTSDDGMVGGQGTTNTGAYQFDGLASDTYYLVFSNLSPTESFTLQNSGADDSIDSDVDGSGRTADIFLSADQVLFGVDAGIYDSNPGGGGGGGGQDGQLSFHVFTDTNGNSVQDNGEADGASGITITLTQGLDSMDLTSEINGTGDINALLTPAEGYEVTFDLPNGTYVTGRNSVTSNIPVYANMSTQLGNFGIYTGPVAEFSVHIYTDFNGDEVQGETDPDGAEKVNLIINDNTNNLIPFPRVGSLQNGIIHGYLAPGTYSFNIAAENTAYTISGAPLPITNVVLNTNDTINLGSFGLNNGGGGGDGGGECGVSCGSIHINLFMDEDGDGEQDSGDFGAEYITITIQTSSGSFDGETDEEGQLYGNLGADEYSFFIHAPDGYEVTGGSNPIIVTIEEGQEYSFSRGIAEENSSGSGSIFLHIFTDTNGNGVQDGSEPDSASGATVHIVGGDLDETMELDEDGNVSGNVPFATYTLTIIPPTGTTVTGGSNPVVFIVSEDQTAHAADRGIYDGLQGTGSTSSGGGNSGSIRTISKAYRLGTETISALPPITPLYDPCLVTGGASPALFSDGQNAATDFLSSLVFEAKTDTRLIQGYADNTFGSNKPLTRFELLKVAMSSNCVANGTFSVHNSVFTDVASDDSEQSRIIGEARAHGIVQGLNNQFMPSKPVTVGEFTKILLSSSAYFPNGKPIKNLPITETGITEPTFAQPVEYAKLLDIYPYDPSEPIPQDRVVTRGEMAIIITRYIKAMNTVVIAH